MCAYFPVTMDETEVQADQTTEEQGSPRPLSSPRSPLWQQHLVAPVMVPRWIQLVLLPLALLGLWELGRAVGSLLVIVIAACVIALILNPLARQLQRVVPRALAIVLSYVAVLLVFAAIGALLSAPVSNQLSHFSDNLPHFVKRADQDLVSIQNFLNHHGIKVHIAQQGHSALQTIEKHVLKSSGSILSFSRDVLGKLVTLSVDLILTFVLSVYLLVYARDDRRPGQALDAPRRRHPRGRLPAC